MNKGIVKVIMVLTAAVAFSGCSSMGTPQPILSAAEAQSTIRVDVRLLEPVAVDQAVAVLAD